MPDRSTQYLPAQMTSLVGREKEIEAAAGRLLLPHVRLLTLTGAGGIGKTRLALATAERVLEAFAEGVFFVVLAPIRDPDHVLTAIGQALGLKEEGARPLANLVKEHLRNKQILLVLDNFEQVIAAGPRVAELLLVSPKLKLMITSRQALHVQGEHLFPVPPLEQPDAERPVPMERLSQCEAVRLFVERAQAVRPAFGLSEDNAGAIAEICYRLEGLPLAIELAAARVAVFSPRAMLGRMENRLKLLTGGPSDLPERLQTMRNAITWSYDLLDEGDKKLFRRLSVFVGGCTLEAAEAVCNDAADRDFDITDGLASLVRKCLLKVEEGDEPRFVMLETIQEYGKERLEETGEIEAIRRQHARFMLGLAEKGERELGGAQRGEWIVRLEAERDNFREALTWGLESGDGGLALRLARLLGDFWATLGHLTEARAWLARALAIDSGVDGLTRALALNVADSLARHQGDFASTAFSEEALAIGRARLQEEIGSKTENLGIIIEAVRNLSARAWYQGQFSVPQSIVEEGLAILRRLDDKANIALALWGLGLTALGLGDNARARSYLEEGMAAARQSGNRLAIGSILLALGYLAMAEEDYASARLLFSESLAIARELGIKRNIGRARFMLAWAAFEQGDYLTARSSAEEALVLLFEVGDKHTIGDVLLGFAMQAVRVGEAARSARLLGYYEALRESMGVQGSMPFVGAAIERTITNTRSGLSKPDFAAAWAEGRALNLEQAIDLAVGLPVIPAEPAAASGSTAQPGPLTRREQEVAALIALGISNREIATRLVISERTVHRHVANILGKLELTSRVQLAMWSVQHGLVQPSPKP